jgi:hypothetical protein
MDHFSAGSDTVCRHVQPMMHGLKLHIDPVRYRFMYSRPDDTSGRAEEGPG